MKHCQTVVGQVCDHVPLSLHGSFVDVGQGDEEVTWGSLPSELKQDKNRKKKKIKCTS